MEPSTMKQALTKFTTLTIALGAMALFSIGSVQAADRPNLLVMGEDADKDSVPRNSRVFKRVLNAMNSQIQSLGFDVYDETVVTLDNFAQGRVRRNRAELVDIGRSVRRPPIDVVTSFTIYASLNLSLIHISEPTRPY